ncbi:MAG: hypothetical protein NC337_16095, partial [Roseburia sp.]|nr:hypothetical protein [Roseburia sp.]
HEILYQFLEFTQNLKRSRIFGHFLLFSIMSLTNRSEWYCFIYPIKTEKIEHSVLFLHAQFSLVPTNSPTVKKSLCLSLLHMSGKKSPNHAEY